MSLAQLNEMVYKSSLRPEKPHAILVQQVANGLSHHFPPRDITLIRSLQLGNSAALLGHWNGTLCVVKEYVEDGIDWDIGFGAWNDIVMSLYVCHFFSHFPHLPKIEGLYIHPNLVRVVTEFVPLSFRFIFEDKPPLDFIRKRLQELCVTVHLLHQHGFAHRDIKPENIRLRHTGELVLIDFDQASRRPKNAFYTRPVCSAHTRAPELNEAYKDSYDGRKCDVFAIGCTFYAMAMKTCMPFSCESEETRIKEIRDFYPSHEFRSRVKKHGTNLLQLMLHIDPNRRPTMEEVLKHPFFME